MRGRQIDRWAADSLAEFKDPNSADGIRLGKNVVMVLQGFLIARPKKTDKLS